jgi:hypothetical protein
MTIRTLLVLLFTGCIDDAMVPVGSLMNHLTTEAMSSLNDSGNVLKRVVEIGII